MQEQADSLSCGTDGATYWVLTEDAVAYGVTCSADDGSMQVVDAPAWYKFAGRPEFSTHDAEGLNSEVQPWDSTCEAEGTGTSDSGTDMAEFELVAGSTYTLVFYPREDGVGLDAWVLTGPASSPPDAAMVLVEGSSTLCAVEEGGHHTSPQGAGVNFAALVVSMAFLCAIAIALAVKRKGVGVVRPSQGAVVRRRRLEAPAHAGRRLAPGGRRGVPTE